MTASGRGGVWSTLAATLHSGADVIAEPGGGTEGGGGAPSPTPTPVGWSASVTTTRGRTTPNGPIVGDARPRLEIRQPTEAEVAEFRSRVEAYFDPPGQDVTPRRGWLERLRRRP